MPTEQELSPEPERLRVWPVVATAAVVHADEVLSPEPNRLRVWQAVDDVGAHGEPSSTEYEHGHEVPLDPHSSPAGTQSCKRLLAPLRHPR